MISTMTTWKNSSQNLKALVKNIGIQTNASKNILNISILPQLTRYYITILSRYYQIVLNTEQMQKICYVILKTH